MVHDNLTSDERLALDTWRKKVLFNPDGDLVMRLQDKGNRFVIVDKQTDKLKAEQQISKSNFIRLDYDPTEEHISFLNIFHFCVYIYIFIYIYIYEYINIYTEMEYVQKRNIFFCGIVVQPYKVIYIYMKSQIKCSKEYIYGLT